MPVIGRKVDLLVVGGGFWGMAAAIEGAAAGMKVLVLDDGRPQGSSRNAAGIVCKHWYKQETIRKMIPNDWTKDDVAYGVQFLERFGLERTGEDFSSYSNATLRDRADCYLVPDCRVFNGAADREAAVVRSLKDTGPYVVADTDAGRITADWAVVAAGAATDAVLAASGLPTVGVKALRGRAVVARAKTAKPWTLMTRPYTHWTLRPWPGGRVRLGDTVERLLDRGNGPVEGLTALLGTMSPTARVEKVLDGLRPVCGKFVVRRVTGRVIAATGGHRVGLGIAGTVGRKCLEIIAGGSSVPPPVPSAVTTASQQPSGRGR